MTLSSPISVSTPVKQVNAQGAKTLGGLLSGLGNAKAAADPLLALGAALAGAIIPAIASALGIKLPPLGH